MSGRCSRDDNSGIIIGAGYNRNIVSIQAGFDMARILPILSQLDDIAEAIAEPPERRPFARAIGVAGRKICDRRSANPAAAGYGGFLGAAVDGMCAPYWAEQGYSAPVSAPQFTGGQCEVPYIISFGTFQIDVRFCSDPGIPQLQTIQGGDFSPARTGPILGLQKVEDLPGDCGNRRVGVNVTTPAGTFYYPVTNTGSNLRIQSAPVVFSVRREDGQSDNCGDPPGQLEPGPTPAPDPGPIPPGEDVFDDPISGPQLPVPDLPGLPGFPSIPVPKFPFSPPAGPSSLPGDVGQPGTPVDTGADHGGATGGSAEGNAPDGSELVGLRLNLVTAPPKPREYGDGIYIGGAYIRMGTSEGLDQDLGGVRILPGQFFFAEVPGLTKWRVDANLGYIWQVIPYYREVV